WVPDWRSGRVTEQVGDPAIAAPATAQRDRERDHDERQEVDRVASLLEGWAAIGGEQRHAQRVSDERERDEAEGATRSTPHQDERGSECHGQEPVNRRQPDDPFPEKCERSSHPRERRRLAHTAEPPNEAPLDLGGGGRRIRCAGGPEAEEDGGRHDHERDDREDADAAEGQRARGDEEWDEKERFWTRQHGQCCARGGRELVIVCVREERGGQRETGGPGNLPLARDEERERGQGRGDYETVSTPPSEAGGTLTAIEHARRRRRGEGAARGRRCSPRSRRASYRATARRDSG